MKKSYLAGLEMEFHLINKDGAVVNDADLILEHPKRTDMIVPEISESMIEVISKPDSYLLALARNMLGELEQTKEIADEFGLSLLPSTSVGYANLTCRDDIKFQNKQKIMGEDALDITFHVCGTHAHIDKADDVVKQFNVMTALDPLFSLMSSSPFYNGENTLNDYRVNVYRGGAYQDFPEHGWLQPYVGSLDELVQRGELTRDLWKQHCESVGADSSPYTEFNSYWGPLRFCKKTIESRGPDANKLSAVMAFAATHLGITRNLDAVKEFNGDFYINGMKLPSFDQLKKFEQIGIYEGINNPELHAYLAHFVDFAKQGLDSDEVLLLKPFEYMLTQKENFSDEITNFAKSTGEYVDGKLSEKGSNLVRKYIANEFEKDLHECARLYR